MLWKSTKNIQVLQICCKIHDFPEKIEHFWEKPIYDIFSFFFNFSRLWPAGYDKVSQIGKINRFQQSFLVSVLALFSNPNFYLDSWARSWPFHPPHSTKKKKKVDWLTYLFSKNVITKHILSFDQVFFSIKIKTQQGFAVFLPH